MGHPDILDVRRSFHTFIDPMWQYGRMSRDAVYSIMSNILKKEAHVANMTLQEMKRCAERLVSIDSKSYPCYRCINCIATRHFFPVCKKQIERRNDSCYAFEPKELLSKR